MGLTTGSAPFIEAARDRGQLFLEQPYDLYSEENHAAWRTLFGRIQQRWARYANPHFLEGLDKLQLPPDRIPRLDDVNRFLQPRTGFEAKPVSGYVPAFLFFDCLRRREFPTTITIRPAEELNYLPEPDIFHDVAGHVPMHTDKAFADSLVRFGDCALTAAELVSRLPNEQEKLRRLENIIRAMARFFWFSVEFGLMRSGSQLKACGSGLLSSFGELDHALISEQVQRIPLTLEHVIHQPFEIHHYQPLLMIVDSFDQLYEMVDTLERWMREGKLDNVAPGEPSIEESDLRSFLLPPSPVPSLDHGHRPAA
ncbi:MAG: phenylalanine 4-monooxygenase [Acidimicrobiia bacterium]|nr:phenylalanine 4-monooxygenase [Acidimicrobiia bacterium]